MAKLAQKKKAANGGAKSSTASKSKKAAKAVETSDEEESFDDDEGEDEENGKETKSTLLNECKLNFNTQDLYEVLNLEKKTATQSEIKKAYYKLSLKYHPDKVTDESLKEESKLKFQIVGKIYSILSDEEKKTLYDESGVIEGEDNFTGSSEEWRRFSKISEDDIKQFFGSYKSSEEEKKDLLAIYEKSKGDMNLIMEQMFSENMLEDEPRFREILQNAIDKGEIGKYDKFVSESKRKASKRKANYEKEAKEAEELKKQMGLDEKSLEGAILARMSARKVQSNDFLAELEKKYASKEKGGKNKKSFKLEEAEVESLSEEEEEEDSEESDDNRATSKKTAKSKLKGGKKLAAKPKGKQPIKRLS